MLVVDRFVLDGLSKRLDPKLDVRFRRSRRKFEPDRYRFMSFYLAGATEHFDTFFDEVVDPEWLASNDEEARALRQVDRSRANKCWRVMHRVTYVERPALLDLGTDVRPLSGPPAEPATTLDDVTTRLDTLDRSVRSLQRSVKRLGETTSDEK